MLACSCSSRCRSSAAATPGRTAGPLPSAASSTTTPRLSWHAQQHRQPACQKQQQRNPSLVRRRETLASLLERAHPPAAPAIHTTTAEQQQQPAPDEEWQGPPTRYGVRVRSRAELQAAVLGFWTRTSGHKIPGSDREESLLVEGLADIGVVSRSGRERDEWKMVNQDAHLIQPLPSLDALAAAVDEVGPQDAGIAAAGGPPGAVLLGCFDGHGLMGNTASRYTRQLVATGALQNLWRRLEDQPGGSGSGSGGAQAVLEAAFESAGAAMAGSGLELRESGSTAVVCLVEPGRVTAAWCGDSKAVLGLHVERPDGSIACLVHPLTEDHRPNRPAERQRIEAAGGQVLQLGRDKEGNAAGPFRLCGSNTYLAPRPMVSRAFGDTNAIPWGLTYEPDIETVEYPVASSTLSSTHSSISATLGSIADAIGSCDGSMSGADAAPRHVLILGTDGLWDTTSPVEACLLARSCATPLEAARALTEAAMARWAVETAGVRCDDISVCVAFLPA